MVAEDNYLVREGTRRLLEDSGDADVVAAVGDGDALLQAVAALAPDVVLTDIRLPHSSDGGIEAAHEIRRRHPDVGVVVLSQSSEAAYAIELFRDGTDGLGYLLKTSVGEIDQLVRALREAAEGRSVVDPGVVERLVDHRARQASPSLRLLAPRELEVLREMAEGKTNAGIAESLHLSESAIEKYVNTLFAKLALAEDRRVSRRVAAVLTYLRQADGTSAVGTEERRSTTRP